MNDGRLASVDSAAHAAFRGRVARLLPRTTDDRVTPAELTWQEPTTVAITPPPSTRSGTRTRATRGLAAMLVAIGLMGGSAACGFDIQTNRPYTPAQGINDNVGDPPVQVRNLMVLSRENGVGYLSATITAAERDALVSVAGKPFKADSADGAPFTVGLRNPIGLAPDANVILTKGPLIELKSADLVVGLEAEVTLTFSTAGELKRRVVIVDADEQPYATISPTPSTPAG